MIRTFILLLKLAVLVVIGVWVADHSRPVTATAEIFGRTYQMETQTGWLALIVLVMLMVVWSAARAWEWLHQFSLRRQKRRLEKGIRALTSAHAASLAGDMKAFDKEQARAQAYLGSPQATLLLQAQAAERQGKWAEARALYTRALEDPALENGALKGLESLAQREGQPETALDFAQRLQRRLPRSAEANTSLLTLHLQQKKWDEALADLKVMEKINALSRDEIRSHRVAVWLEKSVAALDDKEALASAAKAHALDSAHVPAAVAYARQLIDAGYVRKARRVLVRTWRQSPHPDMLTLYAVAGSPADPLKKVKEAEYLMSLSPPSPDSHVAFAELCLVAQLWGEARNHLTQALQIAPTAKTYRLLAQLEKEEKNDTVAAAAWLEKAAGAVETLPKA